jgi:hypothetical protein
MKFSRLIITGCLLFSAALHATAALKPIELQAQLQAAKLQDQITAIHNYGAEDLIQFSQQLVADDSQPDIVKERLLMAVVRSLSAKQDTEPFIELTTQLSGYDSQVMVKLHDAGHQQIMTAFPIAGHARAMLTDWHLERDTRALYPGGTIDIVAIESFIEQPYQAEHDITWRRLLSRLDDNNLDMLVANINPQQLSDDQLVALAEQTRLTSLYELLITRLNQATTTTSAVYRSVQAMPETLGINDANQLLMSVLPASPYAAVALHSLARQETVDQDTRDHFMALLANPRLGGDAAIALAKHMDNATVSQLKQHLESDNKFLQRRSLLSLKQSNLAYAQEVLDAYQRRHPQLQFVQEISQ